MTSKQQNDKVEWLDCMVKVTKVTEKGVGVELEDGRFGWIPRSSVSKYSADAVKVSDKFVKLSMKYWAKNNLVKDAKSPYTEMRGTVFFKNEKCLGFAREGDEYVTFIPLSQVENPEDHTPIEKDATVSVSSWLIEKLEWRPPREREPRPDSSGGGSSKQAPEDDLPF